MIRLADIRAAVERDGRVVLVLVTETGGSAPREPGAAMLVGLRANRGTVGGGTVEHRATEIAHAMLSRETGPRAEVDFPLGPALDQCCGGRMRLAFALLTPAELPGPESAGSADREPSPPDRRREPGSAPGAPGAALELWPGGPVFREPPLPRQAIVYGAGHVGTALVRALAPLPFRALWVDDRAGACAGAPPGVEAIETPLPESMCERAEADALHVVLTHSHALDLEIVTAVLRRGCGFCGLIGSATKRALFRRRLAERGIGPAAIARLTCPIGIAGLRDRRPEVIAASVAAQLLQADAALAARRPAARAG